jgi:TRAP-type C4-dicarboxylate transport system permease small subunit
MRSVTRLIDFATTVLAGVAGVAVVLLMLHVTADVVARAVLGNTFPGTIIIVSNYYMIFIVCLPLAMVERADAHIGVDVVTNLFPEQARHRLIGWTYLLSAVVFGLVAYASWIEAVVQFNSGKFALERDIVFPTWIGYFAVPVGYGMGTIYAVLKFVRFLLGQPTTPDMYGSDHQPESLSDD